MNKTNFFGYMASVVSYLEEEQRHGTAHVYRSVLRRVIEFEGLDVLEFNDLTPLWLRSFQEYLLSRQLHWNTISTYMRMLRATYFRAVDDGLAPYRRFLLRCMLRGMPFADVAYLRHCDYHNNVIVYRRKKTGAWLTVRVEGKALEIIRSLRNSDENSPYLFPLIHNPGKDEYRQYQNALRGFNYRLKKLKEHINGVTGLTSYTARHSWATIANNRDYQPELISNAMGHSSVKVTETYFMKHTVERINEMNKGIISYIFTK